MTQGSDDAIRLSLPEKLLLHVGVPLLWLFAKLLCLSCRVVRIDNRESEEQFTSGYRGAVYATWHQRMFYFFHYFGARHVTMMISRSKDGEYAWKGAKLFGFKCVRGSSSRAGRQARDELIEKVREGELGGMLADGPKGPPREAKIGSVLIAKEAGVPLVPMMYGASRRWVFNSWDRYIVPKPFSKIYVIHGDPILIPADADNETVEAKRKEFEDALNQNAELCDRFFNQEPWRFDAQEADSKRK